MSIIENKKVLAKAKEILNIKNMLARTENAKAADTLLNASPKANEHKGFFGNYDPTADYKRG